MKLIARGIFCQEIVKKQWKRNCPKNKKYGNNKWKINCVEGMFRLLGDSYGVFFLPCQCGSVKIHSHKCPSSVVP